MNDTILEKGFAFPKTAMIRIATAIALMVSVVLLLCGWFGIPALLVATKSLTGQHPQFSDPLALVVFSMTLSLGLCIPFTFLVAVTTIRSQEA